MPSTSRITIVGVRVRLKGSPSEPVEVMTQRSVPSATSPARTTELSWTSIREPLAISCRRMGRIRSLPLTTVASGVRRQASMAKQEAAESRSPRLMKSAKARVLSCGAPALSTTAGFIASEEFGRVDAAVAEFVAEDQVVGLVGVALEADDHLQGAVLVAGGELAARRFQQFHLGLDSLQPLGQLGGVFRRFRHGQQLGASTLERPGGGEELA